MDRDPERTLTVVPLTEVTEGKGRMAEVRDPVSGEWVAVRVNDEGIVFFDTEGHPEDYDPDKHEQPAQPVG